MALAGNIGVSQKNDEFGAGAPTNSIPPGEWGRDVASVLEEGGVRGVWARGARGPAVVRPADRLADPSSLHSPSTPIACDVPVKQASGAATLITGV